jgi:hypothetical protein
MILFFSLFLFNFSLDINLPGDTFQNCIESANTCIVVSDCEFSLGSVSLHIEQMSVEIKSDNLNKLTLKGGFGLSVDIGKTCIFNNLEVLFLFLFLFYLFLLKVILPDFPVIYVTGTLNLTKCIWTLSSTTEVRNVIHIRLLGTTGILIGSNTVISSYTIPALKFITSNDRSNSEDKLIDFSYFTQFLNVSPGRLISKEKLNRNKLKNINII